VPIIEKETMDEFVQFKQQQYMQNLENQRKLSIEYFKEEQSKLNEKINKKSSASKKSPAKKANLRKFTSFNKTVKPYDTSYDLNRS
jgi:hypothetical protein